MDTENSEFLQKHSVSCVCCVLGYFYHLLITVILYLQSGTTEAYYRSTKNRAYYGAFGYIRNRLSIFVDSGSVHQDVIKTLANSESLNKKKLSKRLEALFKKRRDTDYKYHEEIKQHNCKYGINEAEDIVRLFDEPDEDE